MNLHLFCSVLVCQYNLFKKGGWHTRGTVCLLSDYDVKKVYISCRMQI